MFSEGIVTGYFWAEESSNIFGRIFAHNSVSSFAFIPGATVDMVLNEKETTGSHRATPRDKPYHVYVNTELKFHGLTCMSACLFQKSLTSYATNSPPVMTWTAYTTTTLRH